MTHAILTWKPAGHVYLWRYSENTRNYPGWHLSTDRLGGTALLELFSLLPTATTQVHRTVPLTSPTAAVLGVPNNRNGRARFWAPTRWRLLFDPIPEAAHSWLFPAGIDPAVLTFGSAYLPLLVRGVNDVLQQAGDYSIAHGFDDPPDNSRQLWFWW